MACYWKCSFTHQQVLETPAELNKSRASVELADLELVESTTDNIEDITINFSLILILKTQHLRLST